tara:strand:+ start:31716 stop:31901 length:186 start_codon:yes stop_codon:yes gene_type:complete
MIRFIKNFLQKRESNNIRKKISRLQKEAMGFQRNGNLRQYAATMQMIENLEQQLVSKDDED